MSQMLQKLAMAQTKALVNLYTWTTLPLYTIVQRPWRRLRLSKGFGVKTTVDTNGRTIYYRPSPAPVTATQPFIDCHTFPEMFQKLGKFSKITTNLVI